MDRILARVSVVHPHLNDFIAVVPPAGERLHDLIADVLFLASQEVLASTAHPVKPLKAEEAQVNHQQATHGQHCQQFDQVVSWH